MKMMLRLILWFALAFVACALRPEKAGEHGRLLRKRRKFRGRRSRCRLPYSDMDSVDCSASDVVMEIGRVVRRRSNMMCVRCMACEDVKDGDPCVEGDSCATDTVSCECMDGSFEVVPKEADVFIEEPPLKEEPIEEPPFESFPIEEVPGGEGCSGDWSSAGAVDCQGPDVVTVLSPDGNCARCTPCEEVENDERCFEGDSCTVSTVTCCDGTTFPVEEYVCTDSLALELRITLAPPECHNCEGSRCPDGWESADSLDCSDTAVAFEFHPVFFGCGQCKPCTEVAGNDKCLDGDKCQKPTITCPCDGSTYSPGGFQCADGYFIEYVQDVSQDCYVCDAGPVEDIEGVDFPSEGVQGECGDGWSPMDSLDCSMPDMVAEVEPDAPECGRCKPCSEVKAEDPCVEGEGCVSAYVTCPCDGRTYETEGYQCLDGTMGQWSVGLLQSCYECDIDKIDPVEVDFPTDGVQGECEDGWAPIEFLDCSLPDVVTEVQPGAPGCGRCKLCSEVKAEDPCVEGEGCVSAYVTCPCDGRTYEEEGFHCIDGSRHAWSVGLAPSCFDCGDESEAPQCSGDLYPVYEVDCSGKGLATEIVWQGEYECARCKACEKFAVGDSCFRDDTCILSQDSCLCDQSVSFDKEGFKCNSGKFERWQPAPPQGCIDCSDPILEITDCSGDWVPIYEVDCSGPEGVTEIEWQGNNECARCKSCADVNANDPCFRSDSCILEYPCPCDQTEMYTAEVFQCESGILKASAGPTPPPECIECA